MMYDETENWTTHISDWSWYTNGTVNKHILQTNERLK